MNIFLMTSWGHLEDILRTSWGHYPDDTDDPDDSDDPGDPDDSWTTLGPLWDHSGTTL